MWTRAADVAGVPRFTLMGVLGATIERGMHHNETWGILGVEHPEGTWVDDDWYPDAVPCIERLRDAGYRVCASATRRRSSRRIFGPHVDFVGSAARWGVWKPEPAFFARVIEEMVGVEPAKIAYVGDRVDNDVRPGARGRDGRRAHPPRPVGAAARAAAGGDRDPFARRAAGGAGVSFRVGIGVDAHALEPGVPLVLGGVTHRPSARARRPLRRRRARARADRRAARRRRPRRHRLALPLGRRAVPRRGQPRPAARGLPAGTGGGLEARQRRLRPRRRGAEDRAAPRRDATAPVGGRRRRRGERARDDHRPGSASPAAAKGLAAHAVALLER